MNRNEKKSMLETRQSMRKEIERSKQQIIQEFEQKKKHASSQEGSGQEGSGIKFEVEENQPGTESMPVPSRPKTATKSQKKASKEETSSVKKSTKADIEKEIEAIKLRQNHEMLLLLEEEQENEKQREEELKRVTDPQDRKRLEKILGMERAKAHSRIQQMVE